MALAPVPDQSESEAQAQAQRDTEFFNTIGAKPASKQGARNFRSWRKAPASH
jgi:hypothetical protein